MIWPSNSLFFEHPDIFGVSFDSRAVKPGDLFIALPGACFDGHDFVEDAFKNGAVCALVERKVCSDNIVVDSTLESFVKIAKFRRSLFSGHVVAVTGSVGKSTCRYSLVKSLSSSFKVGSSIKNYNTLVGLAHFFSQFDLSSDFLVAEIGIERAGEMDLVADLVSPHYSLLTNVSSAHSYALGSLLSIFKEKSRIFNYTSSCAFFLQDVWYSAFLISLMGELGLDFRTFDFSVDSNTLILNAMISLFRYLDVSSPSEVVAIPGRRDVFSFSRGSFEFVVIDSSYNANMASMIADLAFFKQFTIKGLSPMQGEDRKKIAILGDMWGFSSRHHEFLSVYCDGVYQVWLVGPGMYHLHLLLPGSLFFESVDSLISSLRSFLSFPTFGCDFFIKGSNCIGLGRVVSFFKSFLKLEFDI